MEFVKKILGYISKIDRLSEQINNGKQNTCYMEISVPKEETKTDDVILASAILKENTNDTLFKDIVKTKDGVICGKIRILQNKIGEN